jgi:hypothetical protein
MKEKTAAVQFVKCRTILSYSAIETGNLHKSHHSCKFSAGQGNIEEYLHP